MQIVPRIHCQRFQHAIWFNSLMNPLNAAEPIKGTDTALSALVACTNVIGHKCAVKMGIDIGHLQISAKCRFNRLGVTLAEDIDVPFEVVDLQVVADGSASLDELQKLATEVAKFCPLAKLFRQAGTIINEEWQKA